MVECVMCHENKNGAFLGHVCGDLDSEMKPVCIDCTVSIWGQKTPTMRPNICSACTCSFMTEEQYKKFLEVFEGEIPSEAARYMKEVKEMIKIRTFNEVKETEEFMSFIFTVIMGTIITFLIALGIFFLFLGNRTEYYMENDNLYARILMTNATSGIVNQTLESSVFVTNTTMTFMEFGGQLIFNETDELIRGFCGLTYTYYFCALVFPLHTKE